MVRAAKVPGFFQRLTICGACLLPALGLAACATGPATDPPLEAQRVNPFNGAAQQTGAAPRPASETVSMHFERGPCGLALRQLSEASGAGVVLMNGLELFQVGPYTFEDTPTQLVIQEIARDINGHLLEQPGYTMLYAEGYDALGRPYAENWPRLDAGDRQYDIEFGADTPVYSAFAFLGLSLGLTIIGDNAVATAACGELHLRGASLSEAIEAVLRSARITPEAVRVRADGDYIFVHSSSHAPRNAVLMNPAPLDTAAKALLDRRVDVTLPFAPEDAAHVEGAIGSRRLSAVLDSLSEQLGVRVRAEGPMEKLPVNPTVMTGVRLETAMELLIHQWLAPEFGYEVSRDGIMLRHVGPETAGS